MLRIGRMAMATGFSPRSGSRGRGRARDPPRSRSARRCSRRPGLCWRPCGGGVIEISGAQVPRPEGRCAASDRVGPLNLSLADRLEMALALAADVADPPGLIRDAAPSPPAPRRQPPDRVGAAEAPRARLPLSWGQPPLRVKADAFLTGEARLSPDRREITVEILAFGKDNPASLEHLAGFTARTDAPLIAEAAESFVVRGVLGPRVRKAPTESGAEGADAEAKRRQEHPLQGNGDAEDGRAPLALDVLYGDRPCPLEFEDGQARIREPDPGTRVTLVLRKTRETSERYAVVLKVNGRNTLFEEEGNPAACHKWVLGRKPHAVRIEDFRPGRTPSGRSRSSRPSSRRRRRWPTVLTSA
ncbi:MAG: hypothetical protein WKF75_00060 [Singulisphaera sp.]